MSQFKIKDIAPTAYEYPALSLKKDNDIHLITENLVDFISTSHRTENEQYLSDTEYVAHKMDEYFATSRGMQDYHTLQDTASALSAHVYAQMSQLNKQILPEVASLETQVQNLTKQYFTKSTGYEDIEGKTKTSIRSFALLNMLDIYYKYHNDANGIATELCEKYNFNIAYLTPTNLASFGRSLDKVRDIDVSPDFLKAVLEEVTINIQADKEGVNVDTNSPDDVTVTSDGDTVDNNDTTTVHPSDEPAPSTEPNPDDTTDTDINIQDDETNSNISITINGEEKTTEELMVKACFSEQAQNALHTWLFGDGFISILPAKNIKRCLYFIKHGIDTLIFSAKKNVYSHQMVTMLTENTNVLKDYQKFAILCLDIASQYHKDTLIIGEDLLNQNLVSRAMDKGCTDILSWAEDHLRLYHNRNDRDFIYSLCNHTAFPIEGIKLDTVLTSRPSVSMTLTQHIDKNKSKFATIYRNCMAKAFVHVLQHHIDGIYQKKDAETYLPQALTRSQFYVSSKRLIQDYATDIEKNSLTNTEDLIARYYLTFFGNDIQKELYNKLTLKVATLSSTDMQNPQWMQQVSTWVSCDMMMDTLLETLLMK